MAIIVYGTGCVPQFGYVRSIESFDGDTKRVLGETIGLESANDRTFTHAAMVTNRDSTLFVCFELDREYRKEEFLKEWRFSTQDGKQREVPMTLGALPWWHVDPDRVEEILRPTHDIGTVICVVKEDDMRRVFMFTDGGPDGFSEALWRMVDKQQ